METKVENSNRVFSIQLIRVMAMFMIIFDHILCALPVAGLSVIIQVLNSGVFIFLFLSGILFGDKEVIDWKKWFGKRFLRIFIPLWIFGIVDMATSYFLWETFSPKYILYYLFNIQGIFQGPVASTNLWFVTFIMICYLITPILQWMKKENRQFIRLILIPVIVIQIILAYVTDAGLQSGHTFSWCIIALYIYSIGYFMGVKRLIKIIKPKTVAVSFAVSLTGAFLVFLCNRYMDGTVMYDRVIMPYGMICVDLFLVAFCFWIGKMVSHQLIKKIIYFFDKISYEFYIVHGLIMAAITNEWLVKYGIVVYIFSTIVLSVIFAYLLNMLANKIIKTIMKLKVKNDGE